MSDLWTGRFWKAAAERAVRTTAQTLLALWAGAGPLDAFHIAWTDALGVSLGAALLSLLTSLVAEKTSPATGPSFGTEKPVAAGGRRA